MPTVDPVIHVQLQTPDGPELGSGFVVRNGVRPTATFVFASTAEADAAHQKMVEILATCKQVTGH